MTQMQLGFSKDEFINQLKAGAKVDCPCCGRHAQIYWRVITGTAALSLIKLAKLQRDSDTFIHYTKFLQEKQSGMGVSHAKYFGFIEPQGHDASEDEKKKTSGNWRLTVTGKAFAADALRVRKYRLVFDDRVYGQAGEMIGIKDCLGVQFNYRELMDA